jgi:ribosome modulation factor
MYKEGGKPFDQDHFNKIETLRGKIGRLDARPIIRNAIEAALSGKSDWECPYKGDQAELWLDTYYKTKEQGTGKTNSA